VPEVLYTSERWLIVQDPTTAMRPDLVRFVKRSSVRKLLDQVACWTPTGWDSKRWVPRVPIVPQEVLQMVEKRMKEVMA
jgi:hypothetical protein